MKPALMTSHSENYPDAQFEVIEPSASNMIEALRDIGYSLESAVADIIDNSISASACNIHIRFGWCEQNQPWIAIVDDGSGMTDSELVEAMRPGAKDPLQGRKPSDLGRFGLGLKTASFSQCRELTVMAAKEGTISFRQWDLDVVRDRNQWLLRRPSLAEIEGFPLGRDELKTTGTIVLWRKLDRLDLGSDAQNFHKVFNERINTICEHISLIFHRFISGEPGKPKTKISFKVNNFPIGSIDPFVTNHPATMHLGEEVLEIEGKLVTLRPFVLPHHSKVSQANYEAAGGREGYLRNQGFYIYRNRRLIVHGTWFRMAKQDEITKLARVQVDIPNTLDHLWTIDVRKSRAQPPEAVRRRLRGILEKIREGAKRPYVHRGTSIANPKSQAVWTRNHFNNRISYTPNTAHPLINELRLDLPMNLRQRFDGLMSILGASLPFATLFNDMAVDPKATDVLREPDVALERLADLLYGDQGQLDYSEVEHVMKSTEPFCSSPKFISMYIQRLKQKG